MENAMHRFSFLTLALAIFVIGCGKQVEKNAANTQKSQTSADTAAHGAAGVVPGTYEDWCGEHSVPESVCTRCNPSLVAAFKATDDWCVEHGLPESQCLRCHPDLKIIRPPKPGSI
jgi:hypothetical protein